MSVHWTLENQFDAVLFTNQLRGTEWTGGVKRVGPVGQWNLGPVLCRLLRTDVPTGGESVSGGSRVDIKPCLTAQPERDVGAHSPAHGTLPLVGVTVAPMAPAVVAVHVAAAQVRPGLLLFYHFLPVDAGEGQGVEAHGTLGSGCIDLLPQGFNVLLSWCVEEAVCGSPEEGGPTQVNEGAILQDIGLTFYLQQV